MAPAGAIRANHRLFCFTACATTAAAGTGSRKRWRLTSGFLPRLAWARQFELGDQRCLYTLIGPAKLNDIDPQAWLADTLARINDIPQSRLHELLPWNWTGNRENENTLLTA